MRFGVKAAGLHWQSQVCENDADREVFCQINNPDRGVHQHGDGLWYFYDETEADEFGGFITKEQALESAKKYGESL